MQPPPPAADGQARKPDAASRPPPTRDAASGARPPDAGLSAGSDSGHNARDAGGKPTSDARVNPAPRPSTTPGLRIAFLGDQALGPAAIAVLELIRDERVDMVLHAGDFDYANQPAEWEAQVDAVLGASFPYFASVGNHDLPSWSGSGGYQERLRARLARVPEAHCEGELGVASFCTFRGLFFVLSGVGTLGTGHESYLDQVLARDHIWRLCVWHKNQHDMQVGSKSDEVGWSAYQVCQQHGAPILTAHEHAYARTYTLEALGFRNRAHGMTGAPDQLIFAPGRTAVFLSGLGGHSTRRVNADPGPWWATIYTGNLQTQNAILTGTTPTVDFGVLFIDFHVDGNPQKARGYFKTLTHTQIDHFEMHAQ